MICLFIIDLCVHFHEYGVHVLCPWRFVNQERCLILWSDIGSSLAVITFRDRETYIAYRDSDFCLLFFLIFCWWKVGLEL